MGNRRITDTEERYHDTGRYCDCREKNKGYRTSGVVKRISVICLILLILFLAFRVWKEAEGYQKAEEEYEKTVSSFLSQDDPMGDRRKSGFVSGTNIPLPENLPIGLVSNDDTEDGTGVDSSEDMTGTYPDLSVDSAGLKQANSDYIAWFTMEDPSISYPVVRDPGSNYYLHHTFNQTENAVGCLFTDAASDPAFQDLNTFIYGHNMYNGSMFGRLKEIYNNPSGYPDPYFYLDVMGNHYVYRVFAVDLVKEESMLFRVPAADGYDSYVKEILRDSSTFRDAECPGLSRHNPIVTLSTCYGRAGTDKRLLIFGVRQG